MEFYSSNEPENISFFKYQTRPIPPKRYPSNSSNYYDFEIDNNPQWLFISPPISSNRKKSFGSLKPFSLSVNTEFGRM